MVTILGACLAGAVAFGAGWWRRDRIADEEQNQMAAEHQRELERLREERRQYLELIRHQTSEVTALVQRGERLLV